MNPSMEPGSAIHGSNTPARKEYDKPKCEGFGVLVEDAVASAPEALAQHVAGLTHGRNPGYGPAVHAAHASRLRDARLVGAGNGAGDRANGSAGSGAGSRMFDDRHFIGVTLAVLEIDLILLRSSTPCISTIAPLGSLKAEHAPTSRTHGSKARRFMGYLLEDGPTLEKMPPSPQGLQ